MQELFRRPIPPKDAYYGAFLPVDPFHRRG